MQFRHAVKDDLPAILEIVHDAQRFMATQGIDQWQDGYPSEDVILQDIALNRGYVIADETTALAYAVFIIGPEPTYSEIDGEGWRFGDNYLTIHRICVSGKVRKTGLASMLLDNAIRMAMEKDATAIRIDTHRGNLVMRSFVEKHGFIYRGLINVICKGDTIRVAYERPV